tara:strand:- start:310 stop:804 length:495 start_codon:yes stop_codon:yes gene_type:complete
MNLVPIKDYEDLYSFDLNTNEVYSHKYKKYRKLQLDKDGYYYINLYKNNKEKSFKFHRLIYEAHFGVIPDKMCIDHIDCNKQNNNIENLRLATRSENQHNSKTQKNNLSTGYKNIRKTKFNTYYVRIYKNYKVVYDKTFKTLKEAILNRDVNLVLHHGEFCNLG